MQTTKAVVTGPEWAKPPEAETLLAFGDLMEAANFSAF